MEMDNLPLLLLAVLQVCTGRVGASPALPDKDLTCYSDYNHIISCVWNSTNYSEHKNAECRLYATRINTTPRRVYATSCDLKPVTFSRPGLQNCTLDFKYNATFQKTHELSINVSCEPVGQILNISFKPYNHIKLSAPGKPDINITTVTWFPQKYNYEIIEFYDTQLQWKKRDQSWKDANIKSKSSHYELCTTELDEESLEKGETYEARVRVKAPMAGSIWSDWSPAESWESSVGTQPLSKTTELVGSVLGVVIMATVLAVFLALVLLHKNDKKPTWVLIVDKIRGPPLPDPKKSFLQNVNFQNWLSPHFDNKYIQSSLKAEEIVSVEVSYSVDAVTPVKKKAPLQEKMKSESGNDSTSSGFSNPSYSQLCPPSSTSLPKAGIPNLRSADTLNGSAGSEGEGKSEEQIREEQRRKELELRQLLSKGLSGSECVQVVSDYERVEKQQVEHFRLQSQDSGEEVSQESLEADGIMTGARPEGREEERQEAAGKVDFQKLFGNSGNVFGKGSIQVCSDYEQVQKLEPGSPELPSLDSGVSSGGEEQVSQDESLEDVDKCTESTSFLFPPPASCASPCSLSSFPQLPFKFLGAGLSPALHPASHLSEVAPMSQSIEPSGDGYMAVRQEGA